VFNGALERFDRTTTESSPAPFHRRNTMQLMTDRAMIGLITLKRPSSSSANSVHLQQ
jgi:hypothetical protein